MAGLALEQTEQRERNRHTRVSTLSIYFASMAVATPHSRAVGCSELLIVRTEEVPSAK